MAGNAVRRDKIWYREELLVFRTLIINEIGRNHEGHQDRERRAIGTLLMKLDEAIESAPSLRSQEGSA